MSKNFLYIPEKLKVGYIISSWEFGETPIAYFIYWDEKNVLRKETSWENWRDKKINPDIIDNTPLEGFKVFKVRNGYHNSFWEQRDAKIIVQHPTLKCVFEITPANLLEIIMAEGGNGINNEGIIQSPCVMSWHGTALVLMSTKCPEYESSYSHSLLIRSKTNKKIKPVIGHTYRDRDGNQYTFIGREKTYEEKVFTDPSVAEKQGCLENYVLREKMSAWRGDDAEKSFHKIEEHDSWFFIVKDKNTKKRNVIYRNSCPTLIYEVDGEPILDEEKCRMEIEEHKLKYKNGDMVFNPYMKWKFELVPLTPQDIKNIVAGNNRKGNRYRDNYAKKWEIFLITKPKSDDSHAYRYETFNFYDNGRIAISVPRYCDTTYTDVGTIEDLINKYQPCKMVFYSYLDQAKKIYEIY